MELHELYIAEGEVIDARYLFTKKRRDRMSDQEKYDDALAQQQGMIEIDDEAWDDLIKWAGFDNEEELIDFLKGSHDNLSVDVHDLDEAARMAWARKGSKVVKKFRCTAGRRKGRIVSTPSQCNAPLNLKARQTLRKTRAAKKGKMARKARRTKRINPASRRVQRLNKRR